MAKERFKIKELSSVSGFLLLRLFGRPEAIGWDIIIDFETK